MENDINQDNLDCQVATDDNSIADQTLSNQNADSSPANNPMETTSIPKLIFKFSVPCVLLLLVGALYNIVDQIFIGRGVGYLGNAATNVVCPITMIALGLALLFGDGCAAYYSIEQGKGNGANSHHIVGTCITLAFIVTAIVTIVGFAAKKPLLYLFGATDAIYSYCDDYMTFIMVGIPFYMFGNVLNPVIRADGSPRYALIATCVGAILNIILDPIAIFVFNAGVKGAAIATAIGQIVSFIMSVVYFIKPKTYRLHLSSFKPTIKISVKIVTLGLTSMLTQLAICVIMTIMNNVLVMTGAQSKYGSEIPLSVIGIVMKVFQIIMSIVIGIAVGAMPVIGYNYGANKPKRVFQCFKIIMITTAIVCAIAMILFEACPQAIINIFGSESDLYNEFAIKCFRIYLCTIVLCGFIKASLIFLQAIEKPIKSMILSLCRDIIFMIPTVYILAYTTDIEGVLWSAPISDFVSCICTAIIVAIELKKLSQTTMQTPLPQDK